MILGVSNIAWMFEDEDYFLALLKNNDIRYLEIAPFKIKNSWEISKDDLIDYKNKLRYFDLTPYSMQAVLFGIPDNIFENPEILLRHFENVVLFICKELDIKRIVFGSPFNRRIPVGMSIEESSNLFVKFFIELSELANNISPNTVICIEPNSKIYNCNFITNSNEGLNIINLINKNNIKLHLDTANMFLEDDNELNILNENVKHFHISEPQLKGFTDPKSNHLIYSNLFKQSKIESISIEKLTTKDKKIDEMELLESIKFCREYYL
jgi:D-psicose/D-tagatose/L-ribulose 3-epimerase